jgi:hypothetical protein
MDQSSARLSRVVGMPHFDMEFLALHVLLNSWTLSFAEREAPAGVNPPAGVSVVGDTVFSHPGV